MKKTNSKVYKLIRDAIQNGKLREPFTSHDLRNACPGLGEGTYNAFLWKHRLGNPGNNSELFRKVSPGKFRLIKRERF